MMADDLTQNLCDRCKDNSERQEFFKRIRELNNEISSQELIDILGSAIKNDDATKLNVFLNLLLTYTETDQQNIALIAGSSAGKSYIPLEQTPYFPQSDVLELGYANPTSFFHQYGLWIRDPRLRPLMEGKEEDEETAKRNRIIVVDLHQKILVFLDAPHSDLLKHLRPLLSHDRKYLEMRITDKSQKAGLRTKRILIIGFPTVVFCSTNTNLDDQEKTRLNL
jgi:hypothetical protein